jgi:hypothetical protein
MIYKELDRVEAKIEGVVRRSVFGRSDVRVSTIDNQLPCVVHNYSDENK